MANPTLGRKYACHHCATKYYDLNKPDPKCPKCGKEPEVQSAEPSPKASRGGGKRGRAAPVYEPKPVEEEEPAFEEDAPAFDEEEPAFDEEEETAFEDEDAADGEEAPAEEEDA